MNAYLNKPQSDRAGFLVSGISGSTKKTYNAQTIKGNQAEVKPYACLVPLLHISAERRLEECPLKFQYSERNHGREETCMEKVKLPELEEVRAMLAEKANAGYMVEVKAFIRERGAGRLSEIDPAEYPALLAEAETL